MKITMYGIKSCHSCKDAEEAFAKEGIKYDYLEFYSDPIHLKEFIIKRDTDPVFKPIKENGYIGIPYFELEDGTKTFDFNEVIEKCKSSK